MFVGMCVRLCIYVGVCGACVRTCVCECVGVCYVCALTRQWDGRVIVYTSVSFRLLQMSRVHVHSAHVGHGLCGGDCGSYLQCHSVTPSVL